MDRRTFIQTTCAAAGALKFADVTLNAQTAPTALEKAFRNPPEDAGLSIVYHWTGGAVTREGITADMEGIAASGIKVVNWFYFDGAGPTNAEGIPTPACLTPEWWGYVEHLMSEAGRLNLIVAPHVCSSWGPAGAPDITPELSQQQLVWSEKDVQGGQPFTGLLPKPERPPTPGRGFQPPAAPPQAGGRGGMSGAAPAAAAPPQAAGGRGGVTFPPTWRSYYRDLAVLAFPVPAGWGETSVTRKAAVTATLPITDLAKAADPANNERVVTTDKPGWIQFTFDRPFTLRAVTMNPGVAPAGTGGGGAGLTAGNPYRVAHSLEVQASDEGTAFRKIGQLNPMGNGWQTRGVNALTHTVTETTGRHFRLVYTPGPPLGYDEGMRTGTRTGGGDFAHMIEPLAFASILLSSTPAVHHLPCKNMTTWGWSRLATDAETPASACVPLGSIVDLTQKLQEDGTIPDWTPPGPGTWKVQRIGYVSQLSSTGGGLHCDKLSADAARVVFHSWFGEIRKRIPGSDKLIPILNIDSWEGGSQNWSPVLPREFRTRRGYDLTMYLPCMTGVVVGSPSTTEGFLLDLRRTISECIAENHYGTMYRLAHGHGAIVMSEAVNPAIAVDGMEYARYTDWIGSEFWVRAGQNWKPNDVGDATAGARIYGRKVNFSEAFTGGAWQDHPFALKAMGDHHYTRGINRMMLHVWNEQYVPTRAPGAPGAGTPFNHTNTWWKPGQPWRDYLKKAQALLQEGDPVSDILYFAGENIPCRSILHPKHGSAWAADPAPPDGYMHDTINRDGLLRLTTVQNGRIVVNGALSYRVLVLRADEPFLTPKVAAKLKELVEAGAVVVGPRPTCSPSLERGAAGQEAVKQVAAQMWGNLDGKTATENRVGKGRVCWGKPLKDVLTTIGVAPDVEFTKLAETATGKSVVVNMSSPKGTNPVLVGAERKGWGVEYLHKQGKGFDFYFLTNQEYFQVSTEVSFRVTGRIPELWHADTGRIADAPVWREQGGRTIVPLDFDPAGSVFVVFRKAATGADPVASVSGAEGLRLQRTAAGLETWASANGEWTLKTKAGRTLPVTASGIPAPMAITGPWNVTFPLKGKPKQLDLEAGSWANHSDEDVKHFSGTATYRKTFTVPAARKAAGRRLLLDLGDVQNLARVRLNGKDLGVLWKAPYVIDITADAVAGTNRIEIEVTNTWFNRLAGDVGKPPEQRQTWVGAAGRGFGAGGAAAGGPSPPPLLAAGLIGPVRVVFERRLSVQM
jgi:hypothetical protein